MTQAVNPIISVLSDMQKESIEYSNLQQLEHKKNYGQFFTDFHIAEYMSSLFNSVKKNECSILDCGAGNGILAVSLLNKLIKNGYTSINLTLFEIDNEVIPMLKKNILNVVDMHKDISIKFTIINENFILYQHTNKYDFIISNPPYFKLRKNSEEAQRMDYIVHGQPNIYMLFMAKSAELLNDNGEMVFITPRSFTSGIYFSKFRKYLMDTVSISNIHIFNSRKKHFKNENILQETIITKMTKKEVNETIISTSEDSYFIDYKTLKISKKYLIDDTQNIIRIPSTKEDIDLLDEFFKMEDTFSSLGYKISTGKVVVFRNKEFLHTEKQDNFLPMLWMNHFKGESLNYPIDTNKQQYIIQSKDSMKLLIPCENYIVVKRFSSKEQKRRINLGYIFKKDIDCDYLGLENHLNYIYKTNTNLSINEMKKLGKYLSSEMVDKYFRIMNGNTQVNASDILHLPIPKKIL